MTSAEKVAELRARFLDELTRPGADPTLSTLYGVWRVVRPLARSPLERLFRGVDLEDAEQLDAWLGLIAGAALELRSDWTDPARSLPAERAQARELLDRVLTP